MFWHDLMEGLLFPTSTPSLWRPHQKGLFGTKATAFGTSGMWIKASESATPKARVLFLASLTHGIYHHLQNMLPWTAAGFEVWLFNPPSNQQNQLMSLQGLSDDCYALLHHDDWQQQSLPFVIYGEGVGAYAWAHAAARSALPHQVKGLIYVGLWHSLARWAKARYGWMLGQLVAKTFPKYPEPALLVKRITIPQLMVSTTDDGVNTQSLWDSDLVIYSQSPTARAFASRQASIIRQAQAWCEVQQKHQP